MLLGASRSNAEILQLMKGGLLRSGYISTRKIEAYNLGQNNQEKLT